MLEGFFKPNAVAIVGASTKPGKLGYSVLSNVIESGFRGNIYPINPGATQIAGYKAYASVLDLPEAPDLAVIVIPYHAVPAALRECGEKGIKSVVIISAGFREASAEGAEREKEVIEIAKKYGIRVIGPNCLGIIDTNTPLNATFAAGTPQNLVYSVSCGTGRKFSWKPSSSIWPWNDSAVFLPGSAFAAIVRNFSVPTHLPSLITHRNDSFDPWCLVGLKLISGEGESTDGPIMQIGNTQTPVRFERGPDEHLAGWFAEAWHQRAAAQFRLGCYVEAIRDCHQALEVNPYHFGAATTMGQAYLHLGNHVSALECFRRALRLNPNLEGVRAQINRLSKIVEDKGF